LREESAVWSETTTKEEVLIGAVFRRRSLWDPNHELHKHTAVLRKQWEEVAE
jgi:hypothetical protein